MMKHVRKEYYRALKNGDDPMRVQTLEYLDRLAGILGIRPRLYRHPHLFMKLAAGPLVPARYRLDGMGSRSGVARKILNSF